MNDRLRSLFKAHLGNLLSEVKQKGMHRMIAELNQSILGGDGLYGAQNNNGGNKQMSNGQGGLYESKGRGKKGNRERRENIERVFHGREQIRDSSGQVNLPTFSRCRLNEKVILKLNYLAKVSNYLMLDQDRNTTNNGLNAGFSFNSGSGNYILENHYSNQINSFFIDHLSNYVQALIDLSEEDSILSRNPSRSSSISTTKYNESLEELEFNTKLITRKVNQEFVRDFLICLNLYGSLNPNVLDSIHTNIYQKLIQLEKTSQLEHIIKENPVIGNRLLSLLFTLDKIFYLNNNQHRIQTPETLYKTYLSSASNKGMDFISSSLKNYISNNKSEFTPKSISREREERIFSNMKIPTISSNREKQFKSVKLQEIGNLLTIMKLNYQYEVQIGNIKTDFLVNFNGRNICLEIFDSKDCYPLQIQVNQVKKLKYKQIKERTEFEFAAIPIFEIFNFAYRKDSLLYLENKLHSAIEKRSPEKSLFEEKYYV